MWKYKIAGMVIAFLNIALIAFAAVKLSHDGISDMAMGLNIFTLVANAVILPFNLRMAYTA